MMNRRDLLQTLSAGFGFTALSGLATRQALASAPNPLAPKAPHFPARAKRVIFMYMQGAPTQHETFDYNPELVKATGANIMKPAFPFVPSGQSGLMVSSLFPELTGGPLGFGPGPRWWGIVLAMTYILQSAVSVALDSRFERGLLRSLFWVIWYPLVFWLLHAVTAAVGAPRALWRTKSTHGTWVSPDRGVRS